MKAQAFPVGRQGLDRELLFSSLRTGTSFMADRERRGLLIKNNGTETVRVSMASRMLRLGPGDEKLITPDEVQDPMLREALQERSISIVRPATEEEEQALQERLSEDS